MVLSFLYVSTAFVRISIGYESCHSFTNVGCRDSSAFKTRIEE
jgi:hypothetical protein